MDKSIDDKNTSKGREMGVFEKARQLLRHKRVFRLATYLYAERTLFVFFWVHFMSTIIVWGKSHCLPSPRFPNEKLKLDSLYSKRSTLCFN
jgi:hypothetical protein